MNDKLKSPTKTQVKNQNEKIGKSKSEPEELTQNTLTATIPQILKTGLQIFRKFSKIFTGTFRYTYK